MSLLIDVILKLRFLIWFWTCKFKNWEINSMRSATVTVLFFLSKMYPLNVEHLSSDESHGGDKRKAKQPAQENTNQKKSKKTERSSVWKVFDTKYTDEDGILKAGCKYCKKGMRCDTGKNDTSALRRHIRICPENPDKMKGIQLVCENG
ncbi:hypothetical protein L1987_43773 [Smallanthus sonchifolius]|uniref:Uncharacterized protein n=1 Tax=Smallanthus sonchifolius TaxID=185202 RepID=A0ACB9GNW0_9ASTR|nr:hypothetical protein L1987_43773 [Smallanthus sonchifolius]